MYYVYVLYMDEIPFYAGMTNNPKKRYKHHYSQRDCAHRNFIRYMASLKNKMMKMKIVYFTTTQDEARKMERTAIKALDNAGFIISNENWMGFRSTKERLPEYPDIGRIANHVLRSDKIDKSITYE